MDERTGTLELAELCYCSDGPSMSWLADWRLCAIIHNWLKSENSDSILLDAFEYLGTDFVSSFFVLGRVLGHFCNVLL